jgi:hypothetical protein
MPFYLKKQWNLHLQNWFNHDEKKGMIEAIFIIKIDGLLY